MQNMKNVLRLVLVFLLASSGVQAGSLDDIRQALEASTVSQIQEKVYIHTDNTCSDISGDAHEVSLKDALLMAKTSCPVCCPQAAMEFYCTADGSYYHAQSDCSGMRNASKVTYAEARVTGKKRCPTCIGGEDPSEEGGEEASAGYYVYATPNGTYYHVAPPARCAAPTPRPPCSRRRATPTSTPTPHAPA